MVEIIKTQTGKLPGSDASSRKTKRAMVSVKAQET